MSNPEDVMLEEDNAQTPAEDGIPPSPEPTKANPATKSAGHPHQHSFMDLPAGYRMEACADHPGTFKLYNVRSGHGCFIPTKHKGFFWQMALDMLNEKTRDGTNA